MVNFTTQLTLSLIDSGEFPGTWGPVINANFLALDALFSGTSGHTHDGLNGNGPSLDHALLANVGSTSHTNIDAHIADGSEHADTKLATVTEVSSGNTFADTVDLRFADSTVSQLSSGVVLVTPTASAIDYAMFKRASSAAIAWTDNFNYASGVPIAQESWVMANSGATHPQFLSVGAAAGLLIPVHASIPQVGGTVLHAQACIPHGTAQRVTAFVSRVAGSAADGTIDTDDSVVITLDLLSSTEYGGNAKPNQNGISLLISKELGVDTVHYEVSIQAGAPGTEVVFNSFSGNLGSAFQSAYGSAFQDLPVQFLEGVHEFSMQRVEQNDTDFYLNYYYNGGLVFRQLFSVSSTDPTTKAFAEKLTDLLALHQNSTEPDYGRMGWSVGYSVATSSTLSVTMENVLVASQDDLDSLRANSFPDPVIVPPADPVCGGTGEFGGLEVGDSFDFDGPLLNGVEDWTISSMFDAGDQGSGNGAGFVVTQNSSAKVGVMWCDAPGASTGAGTLSALATSNEITFSGGDLPMGDATATLGGTDEQEVTVEFLYGTATFPTDPVHPTTLRHSAGSVVASTTVHITSGGGVFSPELYYDTITGLASYALNYGTIQSILPWNETFDVRITPKFSTVADYSVTIADAITVVPANPVQTLQGITLEFYDETVTPASWKPVIGNEVPEGSYIFVGVGAVDLPLGLGFWDVANEADVATWSMADANNPTKNAGHVTPPYALTPAGVTLVDSKFFVGVELADFNPSHTDVTPTSMTFTQTTTGSGPLNVLTALFQISDTQWSDVIKGMNLSLMNPLTGALWGGLDLVLPTVVTPVAPVMVGAASINLPGTGTATELEESLAIDVAFTVEALDFSDISIALVDGWVAAATLNSNTDFSVVDNGDNTFDVVVSNQTLGTGVGNSVTLTVANVAATAGYGSSHTISVGLGELVTSGGPSTTPPPSWTGNPLVAMTQNEVVTFSLPATDVQNSASVSFVNPTFFKMSGTPVYNGSNWNFNAYAVQPVGLDLSAEPPTIRITNPDGQTDDTTLLTTVLDPMPTWTSVTVDGGSEWDITTTNVKTLTFTVADANGPAGALPSFVDENDLLTPWGPLEGTGPYTQAFIVSNAALDGSTTAFRVDKLYLEGNEPMSVALSLPAVEIAFTAPTGIGSGGGTPGTTESYAPGSPGGSDGSDLFSAASGSKSIDATGDRRPASEDSTGIDFAATPAEGHYTEFRLRGTFYPVDGTGSNLTLTLENSAGSSVATSVDIRSATSSAILASALVDANEAGTALFVKVVDNTRTETIVAASNVVTAVPVEPRIRSLVVDPPVAGSVAAVLTIHGTNLQPPTPPSGQSALTYAYAFTNSGTGAALSSLSLLSATATEVSYQVDVSPTHGGESLGVDINYLGGNVASFDNLLTINSTTSGNPSITEVIVYTEGVDPDDSPAAPIVAAGTTALLRITGTGLSSQTVDPGGIGGPASNLGVALEVVGNEGTTFEISSGNGITEALATDRIIVDSLISQSDTEIICVVPATMAWANVRARVILTSPEYHTNGIAEWAIAGTDGTGAGTVDTVTNFGITALWGAPARAPRLNVDATQGDTQLTAARSLQSQSAVGSEGAAFTLLVRLAEAWTSNIAPAILSVPDSVYGCEYTDLQVSTTANPFIFQIQGTVPDPGVGNTYPLGTYNPVTTPARAGLALANGVPIAATLLGSADWGDDGSGISF